LEAIFNELKNMLAAGTLLSSFAAIGLAYLGGILSSLTPCIYPMIPITMGFIGGTAKGDIKTGWILSSAYVLGMGAVYTALGVVASLSGRIFGSMTNTPGWYLFLGAIMIASALWMLDIIKFDPNVWVSKLTNLRRKHGGATVAGVVERNEGTLFGAFILGASSGFIAAPCTTPVLTTILSYIANEKSLVFGGLLMFSFAMGLGTILVAVGTFTGALKVLPKSGVWLQRIKLISGLLILALAEYFIFKAGTLR
jgi:thiol:disulfide interchange protein DsbD